MCSETPVLWFYNDWGQRCDRAWEHQPGYMAWYANASHPRIIPPDDGSPCRSANRQQLIEEEHFREMPDTFVEMTKEELVQEMIRNGSTAHPALMYRIARQCRGIGIGSMVDSH